MVARGAQFKFDRGNESHKELLKTAAGNDELAIFPGGLMSIGMKSSPQIEAQKNSKSKPAAEAVAKKAAPRPKSQSKLETKVSDTKVKKVPAYLAKVRALESEAKKRGDVSEGLKNPTQQPTDDK